jgi:anion-transporting  ArsA/GET3 family ATPase
VSGRAPPTTASSASGRSFLERLDASFLANVGAARIRGPLDELAARRFLFLTGKGGVGKTTVSAALGLALAARGKRVLIVMPHTKERLSAVLGTKPIGPDVTQVADRLWAVNVDPERALSEYGHMVIKVKAVSNAVFNNDYIKSFLRAVPGLYEWSMLGKAWFHTTEMGDDGSHRYDVVIFDAPATGHGLDMLRVPKVILDVAPPGVLRRDAERAVALFRDPQKSGILVVTLPEEMPVTETIELVHAIEKDLAMPVLRLVVNGVMPPLFTDSERASLLAHPELLTLEAATRAEHDRDAAAVAAARSARPCSATACAACSSRWTSPPCSCLTSSTRRRPKKGRRRSPPYWAQPRSRAAERRRRYRQLTRWSVCPAPSLIVK